MALTVQIPLQIDFRKIDVPWAAVQARIVGWAGEKDEDRARLKLEYAVGDRRLDGFYDVCHLPKREKQACDAMKSHSNREIAKACSAFSPMVRCASAT